MKYVNFMKEYMLFILHCSLSVCFYETNFTYKRGHSTAHSTFKTYVQHRKDHLGLFLNTNHVVEEGKLLIKLIVSHSNQFLRYKCKITHCLDSQTLSKHISTIVLNDNKKHSISEVLQFLIVYL